MAISENFMLQLLGGIRKRRLAGVALALLAASQEARFQGPTERKKCETKAYNGRKDYSKSIWAQMLTRMRQRRALQQYETPEDLADARNFQRRFRISFDSFLEIMSKVQDYGPANEQDACGNPACPLDLRGLGVLRVLGRG